MKKKFEPKDIFPIIIFAAVVVFDQLTKKWIMESFILYQQKTVIPGFFDLVYVTNTGAAFGLLAGDESILRNLFFAGVALIAMVVIIYAYIHLKEQGKIYPYSLGLIAGGAIGNLIDRLRFGSVVDFLDFYVGTHHWPAFNVADSAITVGVALFLLASLIQHRNERKTVSGG